MRAVTSPARKRDRSGTRGKVKAEPRAQVHPHRPELPAVAGTLGAGHGNRHDGLAALERQPADAALRALERAGPDARSLGEDHHGASALEQRERRRHRLVVRLAAAHGEGPHGVENPAEQGVLEHLALGHEEDQGADRATDRERVEEAAVVGREDHAALGNVLAPEPAQPEVDEDRRLHDHAHRPVEGLEDAPAPRALVVDLERARRHLPPPPPSMTRTRRRIGRYAGKTMELRRPLNGALAGAAAAASGRPSSRSTSAYSARGYDDVELLGKLVTRGPASPPGSRCTWPTGDLRRRLRARPPARRRRRSSRAWPPASASTSRCGRWDAWSTACTRRATSSSRSPAAARSLRRPGATCSSA